MGFMNWFAPKPTFPVLSPDPAPPVERVPDLGCPDCAWKEFLPIKDVIATDTRGSSRTVGHAVYCARCLCQFVASEAGVYKASPMPTQRASESTRTAPPEPRQLRDSDMANVWEGRRK